VAARSLSTIPTSSPSQIRKIRWGGGVPPPAPPPGAPLRGADEKPIRGLCGRRGGSERNRSRNSVAACATSRPKRTQGGGGREGGGGATALPPPPAGGARQVQVGYKARQGRAFAVERVASLSTSPAARCAVCAHDAS
jgi:hypothetical protein